MSNKKIDMSKYKPFREMGKSCETREICEKKIVWPEIDKVILRKFKFKTISRADVVEVAEFWRNFYPNVYGSSFEFVLFPDMYEELIMLRETYKEDSINKKYACYAVEDIQINKIIGTTLFTKNDKNLSVEWSLGAIHPDYRVKDISVGLGALAVLSLLEKSGAEYLTSFCETWHDISQKLLLRSGWKVAGIFPGQYPRWCGGNKEYRACVIQFYKFIGEGEKYSTKPEEWHLAPEIKKIWDALESINKNLT